MKNKIFLLALSAGFCLAAFKQVTLNGKWNGYSLRPNNKDTARFTYLLQQSGNALNGAVVGPDGSSMDIDSGRVMGNKFSFSISESNGVANISGTYYGDSLGTDVALPNGHLLHMTMRRSR